MERIRIGVQLVGQQAMDAVASAREVEAAGFDLVLLADHIGLDRQSPMLNLAAVAAATERIRLGTYVLNNDMRNPTQLAWEAATLDRLSGGRFELGLGAGHAPQEYAATGIEMSEGGERKARLAESVEIIRRLVDGETVDHVGDHYRVEAATITPAAQARMPILVGGSGAGLLRHAGEHCDGVGFTGLGKTLADGHNHSADWSPERLDRQVAQVAEGSARHHREPDLSALVQMVEITDEREPVLEAIVAETEGLTMEHAATAPYLAVGTAEEIAAHFVECHERWGITTFAVRTPTTQAIHSFAPVLAALR
jgi:probable F420-dependent oxidoreductase